MSFQTKIVQKTSGLNVVNGTPACVVAGADTCDIRVSIWDSPTSGTQLWTETHSNVELGATGGVINLSLNSIAGNWGFDWGADDTIYLQVELDQDGNGDFTGAEVFTRKLISTVPFAYYADVAGSINGLTSGDLVHLKPGTTQTTGDTSNPIIDINENGSGTPDLLKLGVGGSGNRLILTNAGALTIADAFTAGGLITGSNGLTISSGDTMLGGALTVSADAAINGANLTTTQTTFNLINTTATTLNIGGAANTLNLAGGSASTGCTINSSGDLTCSGAITGIGSGSFLQGGNSFGALGVLGTNDSYALAFETNGAERMRLTTNGGLILGATSSISDFHVRTGTVSSGGVTMTASAGSTTFTTSASITLNAGEVVKLPASSQTRIIAATNTGTSFTVTQPFTLNINAQTFEINRRGITVEGYLPMISLNRTLLPYTNQEWLLRVGGTSLATQAFDIYSQTTGQTGLRINEYGDVWIGTSIDHSEGANSSRLYVYGGAQGANIDVMGDASQLDVAILELQSSDYAATTRSMYLMYGGVAAPGTTMGYSNQYLGIFQFNAQTALIGTANNTALRFFTNATEAGRFEANGNFTLDYDLALNGGDLTTNQTTFNLVNTTATTVNFAGAATSINIGIAGASGTLNLMGGSASTGCTLDGSTGNLACAGNADFSTGNVLAGTTTNTAFINAAAATTSQASLRMISSAGTNPSSPNSGDLWWNGTNLQFRTNSTTVDLLAPSFTIANDSLDFDKFSDSLTLDANTDIDLDAFTLSTSGTGALSFGSTGQVTFAGNIDATNGLDVSGAAFTVGGTGVVATTAGALTTTGLITSGNGLTVTSGATSFGGTLTVTGDTALNGDDLTTTQATFNLLNSNATTINFGGAATTMNIGIAGASGTLNLMGGSGSTGCTINGINGGLVCTGAVNGMAGLTTVGLTNIGSTSVNYSPTIGNWNSTGSTLVLNGLDYSVIAFHDSAARVDFIRTGAGEITLGYDGGYGNASVYVPGALTANSGIVVSGGIVSINDFVNYAVNIAAGTSTSTVNISTGNGTQTVNIATGAGAKSVNIGSNTTGSITQIFAGDSGNNSFIFTGVTNTSRNSYLCIGSGNGYVNYNTSCTSSSIRFKENVINLTYGLDEIMALRPVFFNYKPDQNLGNRRNIGFIAEEVDQIIPEVTVFGADGLIESLDYEKLVSLLTVGVQELNTNLQDYQSDINNQLNSLRASVDALSAPDLSGITADLTAQQLRIGNLEARVESLEAGVIANYVLPGTAEFAELVLTGRLNVKGQLLLSNKNIGTVTINAGETEKVITFVQNFPENPIVIAIPTQSSVDYSIQNTTTNSFKIVLDAPATQAVQFNWFVSSND